MLRKHVLVFFTVFYDKWVNAKAKKLLTVVYWFHFVLYPLSDYISIENTIAALLYLFLFIVVLHKFKLAEKCHTTIIII